MPGRLPLATPYTDEYKTECKHAWYAAGRPRSQKQWEEATPRDKEGRKPRISQLRQWRDDYMWDFWADDLDSRAISNAEVSLIEQKSEMLKRHAARDVEVADAAWNHIKESGFDSSASAVQALFKAMENERVSRGIGEMIVKMSTMGDAELKNEIVKMLTRASDNDQIVDVETLPEKEEEITENIDANT